MLVIKPIKLKDANVYVAKYHRHNLPVSGHKWSIACYDDDRICGVAICGQPIARNLDDGETIEARRVCTDGTRNACSFLYGACARIAKEFGYRRIVTYILETEPGTSLKASGWVCAETHTRGVSWDRKNRQRPETEITLFGEVRKRPECSKARWEKRLKMDTKSYLKNRTDGGR